MMVLPRTDDSMVYAAASDADLLAGKWYTVGKSDSFRQCECPSFYPLPPATPGFEGAYAAAQASAAGLPTHVHKTSCGGDWWQLGSYTPAAPKTLGTFNSTPGWEDLFAQRRIDMGAVRPPPSHPPVSYTHLTLPTIPLV